MNPSILKQQARDLQMSLISIRRELHQNPELSMEEFGTSDRIRNWLMEAGLTILKHNLPVGVVAEVIGENPGPTIALRADIDALPINEETGLPFSSKIPGKMHACGHDFHSAAMLGAAMILQQHTNEINGRIRFIFQPGEELAIGAQKMIESGALDGVDAIFGMHNKPEIPVGTMGVRSGPLMASVDRFKLTVKGKGGHAAIPDQVIDPIVTSGAIITGLQSIISRNIGPFENAVVSVAKMEAGESWNVIPEHATLEGTVRTFQPDVRERIPALIERTAKGIATGYGASADFEWIPGLPAVNNDARVTELFKSAANELELNVVEAHPTTGGEDFSLYQEQIPGGFIWMGTSGTEEWHHPKFTLNEEALHISSSLFAYVAILASKSFS